MGGLAGRGPGLLGAARLLRAGQPRRCPAWPASSVSSSSIVGAFDFWPFVAAIAAARDDARRGVPAVDVPARRLRRPVRLPEGPRPPPDRHEPDRDRRRSRRSSCWRSAFGLFPGLLLELWQAPVTDFLAQVAPAAAGWTPVSASAMITLRRQDTHPRSAAAGRRRPAGHAHRHRRHASGPGRDRIVITVAVGGILVLMGLVVISAPSTSSTRTSASCSAPVEVFGGAYVRDSLTALLDLLRAVDRPADDPLRAGLPAPARPARRPSSARCSCSRSPARCSSAARATC